MTRSYVPTISLTFAALFTLICTGCATAEGGTLEQELAALDEEERGFGTGGVIQSPQGSGGATLGSGGAPSTGGNSAASGGSPAGTGGSLNGTGGSAAPDASGCEVVSFSVGTTFDSGSFMTSEAVCFSVPQTPNTSWAIYTLNDRSVTINGVAVGSGEPFPGTAPYVIAFTAGTGDTSWSMW